MRLTPRQIATINAALSHWQDHLYNGENPLDPPDRKPYDHGRNPYLNVTEISTLQSKLSHEAKIMQRQSRHEEVEDDGTKPKMPRM